MPIVTVPGPTGGAGAAVTVTQIVNAQWDNAALKSREALGLVSDALGIAGTAPALDLVKLDADYEMPDLPKLPDTDPAQAERMYDDKRREIELLLSKGFDDFLNKYFPTDPSFTVATQWLLRAIQGGSGINPSIEAAIWQRGRARVLADSQRAKDELAATWAGRRFPIPPGALVAATLQIDLEAGRKLAEVSRDAAIKSFEAELENVRFAVGQALDLRMKAIDAAGSYIKTLILGPQTAMQLATGLAGIQTELSRSLVQFYSAQVTAAEPAIRLAIAQGDVTMRGEMANLQAAVSSQESAIRAVLAGAQMAGAQASAGINGVNAGATISGQDSSQV